MFKRVHGNSAVETNLQLFSFPKKSNPSENCPNWFKVSYSHLEGVHSLTRKRKYLFCKTVAVKQQRQSQTGDSRDGRSYQP